MYVQYTVMMDVCRWRVQNGIVGLPVKLVSYTILRVGVFKGEAVMRFNQA
jgi:hypothetical protein